MTISVFFLGLGIAGVLFAGLLAGCFVQRHLSTKRIGDANDLARRIIEEARKEAQAQKKEILVQGQDELFNQKRELENEYKEQERELKGREKKLQDMSERMEEKMERITQKEQDLLLQERDQTRKERRLEEQEEKLSARMEEQERRLQEVSGLTAEEAKNRLFEEIEARTRHEAAKMMRHIESEAREAADRKAKEILAYELTKLVHGEEEADRAQESAKALFSTGVAAEMPTTELSGEDFTDGRIDMIGVLVKAGLVASRSEGRRAIEQGGVTFGEEKITDVKAVFEADAFGRDGIVVRRGKKNFRKIIVK